MTKKEKIAWAMARVFDHSNKIEMEFIEREYLDCDHCGASETKEKETMRSTYIDTLYDAYVAAKEMDKGK